MSLTKEDILHFRLKLLDPNEDSFSAIMGAMEEYALQEMGSFAEWLAETGLYLVKFNEPYYWTSEVKEYDGKYSTKQVVELYYQSIKG